MKEVADRQKDRNAWLSCMNLTSRQHLLQCLYARFLECGWGKSSPVAEVNVVVIIKSEHQSMGSVVSVW